MQNVYDTIQIFETELKKYVDFICVYEVNDGDGEEGFNVSTKSFRYSISVSYPRGNFEPGNIHCNVLTINHEVIEELAETGFTKEGALSVVNRLFQYDYEHVTKKQNTTLRTHVLNAASTLACKFLHDDRKSDEDLPKGDIEKALKEGVVTEQEIVQAFIEECGFTSITVVENDDFERVGR